MKYLIALLLLCNLTYSQKKLIAFYKVSPKNESFEQREEIKSSKMNFLYKGVDNYLNKLSYVLKIENNRSLFHIENALDINERPFRLAKAIAGSSPYYFSNDSLIKIADLDGKKFHILISKPKWTITNETKEIKGYKCLKATAVVINTKKQYSLTAWFCPSLPYNYGPNLAVNLPGLVLEYVDDKVAFTTDKIVYEEKLLIGKIKIDNLYSEKDFKDYVCALIKSDAEMSSKGNFNE